jgi:hypothetical protein
MLPTLLPFAILSHIVVASGLLHGMIRLLHKAVYHILPVSPSGLYPLAAGFLFGFPLGSKITAQLVEEQKLSFSEGNHLFAVCNNISPVFISGFILTTSLGHPELSGATLAILYLPPLLFFVLSYRLAPASRRWEITTKNPAPRSQINFEIIDAGIMSGFETLTKLGGYIMLFAILSQMAVHIPGLSLTLQCLVAGLLEITNGIDTIAQAALPFQSKYLLAVGLTAFGGISGMAQTASMVKQAGFSMKRYLGTKLLCSGCSVLLAWLYLIGKGLHH